MPKIGLDSAKSEKKEIGSAKNVRIIEICNILCKEKNVSTTSNKLRISPGEQQVFVTDTGCSEHMFPSSMECLT
jgi:hypothetical protein